MRVFVFGIRHVGGRRGRAARVDAGTRRAPFAGTVVHIVTGRRLLNFCAVRTQVDSCNNKLTEDILFFVECGNANYKKFFKGKLIVKLIVMFNIYVHWTLMRPCAVLARPII